MRSSATTRGYEFINNKILVKRIESCRISGIFQEERDINKRAMD